MAFPTLVCSAGGKQQSKDHLSVLEIVPCMNFLPNVDSTQADSFRCGRTVSSCFFLQRWKCSASVNNTDEVIGGVLGDRHTKSTVGSGSGLDCRDFVLLLLLFPID